MTHARHDIPSRLDRLPWTSWHWGVVVALGITWVLDGLEVTIVGAVGPMLERSDTLAMTAADVGDAGMTYLAGAIVGALVLGELTDRLGRKRLFLWTLLFYVAATVATAFSWSVASFLLFRALTGFAIGGEYAAINSAIDELIPARHRGAADLAINGSYWLGTAGGALSSAILLDPRVVSPSLGWRLAFGLGALTSLAVLLVRRRVPESPRWLLQRGRAREADAIVREVERGAGVRASDHPSGGRGEGEAGEVRGFVAVAQLMVTRYRRRAALCLVLMATQAFFYNAIFFTYALVLTRFYAVEPRGVGKMLLPFAIGNFLGPLVLGRLFDTWGRRKLITFTYAASGLLLAGTGVLFVRGALTPATQTLCWSVTFFFGSAAASSAYLSASELFPLDVRGKAIALFYAAGTALGGLAAPALFGRLVQTGERPAVFHGYLLGAALMLVGAATAHVLAEDAEGKSLEELSLE